MIVSLLWIAYGVLTTLIGGIMGYVQAQSKSIAHFRVWPLLIAGFMQLQGQEAG